MSAFPLMPDRSAYAAAGVDVAAGDRAVDLMRAAVESTRRPEVIGSLGGFAAAVRVPDGMRDPVLVSSTDGVGTKTVIATSLRRFDTIGRDVVAMCADDVVCTGAAPLFFLDYLAVGRLEPSEVAELVEGVAAGCRDAGCALVGGETAEHPGLLDPGEFDLAGCCVGAIERDRLIDPRGVRAGDAIVGLASSGLHANGFSLVRGMIDGWDLDLHRPFQEQLRLSLGDAATDPAMALEPQHALATLGEVLLTPSTIYAPLILALRAALEAAGSELRGVAHITGGGLPGNVPRMLPAELGARLDPARWPMPAIVRLIGALAGMDDEEARATFNAGLGMVVAVPLDTVPAAIELIRGAGIEAWHVGHVVDAGETGAGRYLEGALEHLS
jgi:phosphoribosylformylglycinamidine cyclo-ligase